MLKNKFKNPFRKVISSVLATTSLLTVLASGIGGITASAASADYNYYKSDYANHSAWQNASVLKNQEICEEGFTLLKNDDGFLPLQPAEGQSKIKTSVFGKHSAKYISIGYGSSVVTSLTSSLYEVLSSSIFDLNPTLTNFYNNDSLSGSWFNGNQSIDNFRNGLPVRETPITSYTDAIKASYKDYNELAIVVIARPAGEGSDLAQVSLKSASPRDDSNKIDGARYWDDHSLQLNANEVAMLQMVMDNFDDIVIILDCSSYIELGFLNDPTHYLYTDNGYTSTVEEATAKMKKLKSLVNISYAGTHGNKALAKILTGEVNPSGHLADTWIKDMKADPVFQNFGLSGMSSMNYGNNFVHYDEDIYMGYRYYETRYVEEDEATRDQWYFDSVMYPFGYGLSYTTFSHEIVASYPEANATLEKDGKISVTVRVTNTGSVAGKDAVGVYYSAPYFTGGIAKAHVNLADFAKTGIIQPGEYEDVTIEFDVSDMYSYDWSDANGNGFKGYELDPGTYSIVVGYDAHDAAKLPAERTIEYVIGGEGYQYDTDTTTGAKIENRFDYSSGDPSKVNDPETFRGVRQYMSRDDFAGTFPTHATEKKNGMLQKETIWTINPENDATMPWYHEEMPTQAATPGNAQTNKIKLWHLSGRDYDDPLWDELLDQLTIEEMAAQISFAFRGDYQMISSIDQPAIWQTDGPLGRRESSDIQWASNPVLASTWNKQLAYERGRIYGNAIFYSNHGRGGTFGLGLNTHRSPFGGRWMEYFSEDGVFAGKMGAQEAKGSLEKGCVQISKHIMLNDQETSRNNVSTWASEQAIREIYGKSFEIAIKEGGLMGLMTGVNSIGNIPCSTNYYLLEELVRGEWGFRGFIITDMHCEDTNASIRAGIDGLMAWPNPAPPKLDAASLTPTHVWAMRRAMKNTLYMRANSSGINGVGGERLDRIKYLGTDALYTVAGVNNELTVDTAIVSNDPNAKIKYSLADGSSLPEGMVLNADGSISGTPETSGTYSFRIVASEDTNARYPYKDVYKNFRMTVYNKNAIPDQIIYEDVNLGVIPQGAEYSKSIASAVVFDDEGKLSTDITYQLADGSELPAGLELVDGVITGTTTASAGTYFFTVEAKKDGKQTASLDFIVKVNAYMINYEYSELEDVNIGENVSINVGTATSPDDITIKYALAEGSTLPDGLKLDNLSGIISGVPTKAYEDYEFTVVASGQYANPVEVTYKLSILGVVFDDVTYDNLIIGKNYSFKLNAFANDGSSAPIYYELKEGSSLPNGFSLLADGTIVGSGRDWGEQTFTVVAKSDNHEDAEATITLNFYTVFEQPVDGDPSSPIEEEAPAEEPSAPVVKNPVTIVSIVGIVIAIAFMVLIIIKIRIF